MIEKTSKSGSPKSAAVSSRTIQKQLIADFPTRPEFRFYLAASHNSLAIIFANTGRQREAEAAFTDALAIRKQLTADFPTRVEFRQEQATSYNKALLPPMYEAVSRVHKCGFIDTNARKIGVNPPDTASPAAHGLRPTSCPLLVKPRSI